MTVNRSERLLNLLIMLLVTRRAVGKQRIREILYPDASEDAFNRMFDRDKEELRSIGVPIEVVPLDGYFEDEVGYRIQPSELALPEVEFTADEASVIGLATRVWEHSRLAEATTDAVRKLTGYGIDVDVSALDIIDTRIGAEDASFEAFWAASLDRSPVIFDYRRSTGEVQRRHLNPWGVVRYSGRWYVVGFDTDRGGERIFRLSRVLGDVTRRPGTELFEIPAGTDIRLIAQRLAPPLPTDDAVLLVRSGAGSSLRRRATRVDSDVSGPGAPDIGWDRIRVPTSTGLADDLLGLGADVIVESPPSLRDEVIDRLRRTATHLGIA